MPSALARFREEVHVTVREMRPMMGVKDKEAWRWLGLGATFCRFRGLFLGQREVAGLEHRFVLFTRNESVIHAVAIEAHLRVIENEVGEDDQVEGSLIGVRFHWKQRQKGLDGMSPNIALEQVLNVEMRT